MIYRLDIPVKKVKDRIFAREYNVIIDTVNTVASRYDAPVLPDDEKHPGDFIQGQYLNDLRDNINAIVYIIDDPSITTLDIGDKGTDDQYSNYEFNQTVDKINELVDYANSHGEGYDKIFESQFESQFE